MTPQSYAQLNEDEDTHWWYRARRSIAASLLSKQSIPTTASVLEIGCGTGGNLPMLAQFGTLYAFEPHDESRAMANARALCSVASGELPDNIPIFDKEFDVIALFDVLEHIEQEHAALTALRPLLTPQGLVILTVPAFQWLFGPHDRLHRHKRRYNKKQLRNALESAGFRIRFISYWNYNLFPLFAPVRLLSKLRIFGNPGAGKPHAAINDMLYDLVSGERFIIPHLRIPFGMSLIVIAHKT